jgi:hypothetical protein
LGSLSIFRLVVISIAIRDFNSDLPAVVDAKPLNGGLDEATNADGI